MGVAGFDLPFQCDCGCVTGTLLGVSPSNGNRIDCYCADCHTAEVFAAPNRAVKPGPVHLYHTTPAQVRFDTGFDQLAVFSLSPKGVLRWYAACCGAMLFNTLRTPKLAFAAFYTDRAKAADTLGPVKTRANIQKGDGTSRHEGYRHALSSLARTAIPARLTGTWKTTPFFDRDTLAPVRDVYVLTKNERAAASTEPA
jgi:hypothetical protein